jgi:hypothetical protein
MNFYILVNMRLLFFLTVILFSFKIKAQSFSAEKILRFVEILSADSLEGREIGSNGSLKAQHFIISKFKELKLQPLQAFPDFKQSFKFRAATGNNLVGFLKGYKQPEKFIVISAHYDHEGIKNGKVYNGADDNASGVGGLIALLEYFSRNPPVHSLMFVAFDGEERELKGSNFFVKNLPLEASDILLDINMDMISRNKFHQLYVSGTHHYPFLGKFVQPTSTVEIKLGHDDVKDRNRGEDWTFSSDHASFHALKIPFLYFGVEDHEDYHKPTDDFEKIDREFYLNCVRYILEITKTIDQQFDHP